MKPSPEFLEREYNARLAIPDHARIFARWADQAAATRRLRPCLLDLPYGDTAPEHLDFFPTRSESAPLLVFIHGGYWRAFDKSDFSWLAPHYVAHGIAVAMLNYGLAPHTPVEDIVRQVLRAVAWLYRNADRLEFDPERIHLCGHSAGGHLTAMSLAALWPVLGADLPARLVRGGLTISGLFDLEPLVETPFLKNDLRLDVARARRLSPIHMPPVDGVALYTAVGGLESSEFRRQNALIGQRWRDRLVRDVPMPGFHHLDICDELARPASPLFAAALEMCRRR